MKKDERRVYLKENPKIKKRLKFIGFACMIPGVIMFASFIIGFASSFGSFDADRPNVIIPFISMPLMFVGSICLSYGYMGEVSRYTATQVAPVVKDSINYMIDGTKDEVSDLINKAKSNSTTKRCKHCGDEIEVDEVYCDNCGKKLVIHCKICNEENNSNAKFCKACGKSI